MMKVMVVDDEFLIRNLIKNSIDWEEIGMEVVEEASDGEEALEKVEISQPDIIIMDINIPFIDGLKLSQIIHECHPDIKIIILTGYEQFEYIRVAIKIGVVSYIVKPIKAQELKQALLDAKQQICKEAERKKYVFDLESKAKDSYDVLKEKFLNTLIQKPVKQATDEIRENIINKIKYFKVEITDGSIAVMLIEIDGSKERGNTEKECKVYRQNIQEIANEVMTQYHPSVAFSDPNNLMVIIYNGVFKDKGRGERAPEAIGEEIINKVKDELGISITIGVGNIYDGYNKIFLSFQEALRALESKFYRGSGLVIKHEQFRNPRAIDNIFVFEEKNQAILCLRTGNVNELTTLVNKAFDTMAKQYIPRHNVQMVAMELASFAAEYAADSSVKLNEAVKVDKDIFEELRTLETIHDIKERILDFYRSIIGYIHDKRKPKTLILAEKAKHYIEENYYKYYLSLEEIAESLFVNPSYLSNVFKKEMGCSIVEYLTEYRVKKGKEIIDQSRDIQLSEVAQKVGYNDPYYFSKCFKKYYGLSSSKYIEKKLQETNNHLPSEGR